MIDYRMKLLAPLLILTAGTVVAQTLHFDGNWELVIGEDPSSYEVVAALRQDAANTIKDEYGSKDVSPQLAFQCVPGNPEVTAKINWRRFISSFNTEVGFKVDGGKFLWLKWGVDQSNKITLSKTASDSQSLIDHLAGGSELSVEVSPYSEPPVTVQYDLTGLTHGLEILQNNCRN